MTRQQSSDQMARIFSSHYTCTYLCLILFCSGIARSCGIVYCWVGGGGGGGAEAENRFVCHSVTRNCYKKKCNTKSPEIHINEAMAEMSKDITFLRIECSSKMEIIKILLYV